MELKLVAKTARCVVVELTESGKYFTAEEYELVINDSMTIRGNKVITSIYDLKPDREYEIKAVYGEEDIKPLKVRTDKEFVTLNVKDFGALGNGEHDDTCAIQAAIMACPSDSRVLVPEGVYKITSIFLKSNLTLELAKGAVLSAFTDRTKFPIFPGMIDSYDEKILTTGGLNRKSARLHGDRDWYLSAIVKMLCCRGLQCKIHHHGRCIRIFRRI